MTPEGIVIFHRNRHLSILFHINYDSIFGWREHLQDTKFVQSKNMVSYTCSLSNKLQNNLAYRLGAPHAFYSHVCWLKPGLQPPIPMIMFFLKEYAHQLWPWIKTLQIRREFQECPCHPIIPSSSSSSSSSSPISISISIFIYHII